MKCRHCKNSLKCRFLDLGCPPPSNAYLSEIDLRAPETGFPLRVYTCERCWLVQTEDYAEPEKLFSRDYAYFSSTSKSWLEHAARYAEAIIERLGLNEESFVIEVASNDGYLLKNFVAAGIPCLGVEPTESTAEAARRIGVPVLREFFGTGSAKKLANRGMRADLICGNNVYAHVPDINDFTLGLRTVLKEGGTVNLEFPHLLRMIERNQFDTVYHEHFSYLSLTAVNRIFAHAGLRVFDLEELPTHGGSLRIYGSHVDDRRSTEPAVTAMLEKEEKSGMLEIGSYLKFQEKADRVKNDFLVFLLEQKRAGKTMAAYGAAAKGSTLLNYAGVKRDLLGFVCDAALSKQGKYMPGSRIPILPPSELEKRRPDWVVILPWNIAGEVMAQQSLSAWGGKFVVAVPELKVMT